MRKCANCSECFYDEDDNHLYCRANGIWNCVDDEKEFTEEPIWCPMKNIEEASINISNQNPVIALKAVIVCTNTQDEYSAGFRNGIRYAISILTGDEPKYEDVT